MIIDVRKLKATGKTSLNFSFDYSAEDGLITLPGAKFDGAIKVTGTLTLGGSEVLVYGEIEYNLLGQCARCLEDARYKNVVEFDEYFSENGEDEDCYLYKKGIVDLTEMVNDKILTSLPYAIYCKDDCKGLCPICGTNLNNTDCDCQKK